MYCPHCGSPQDRPSPTCQVCAMATVHAQRRPSAPEYVPNHLALSIISTILCCMPLGIVAIIYAAQVNGLAVAGDLHGARAASEKAKLWSYWSIGVVLIGGGIWLLISIGAVAIPNIIDVNR